MPLDRKVAIVNLTTGAIEKKTITLDVRKAFLGGRGLAAYLLYKYAKPGCDPVGPDNAVIFSAGVLGGTLASASARTDVMCKNPLTNLLGSGSLGGFFAPELRWAGFDHVVAVGKAPKPSYLFVHDGEVEIRDARGLWGRSVTEAQWALREELGDNDVKAVVCGPAGENVVRYANVMTGIKNANGRGGGGATMGSKNLKLVAARGTMDLKIAHPREALDFDKRFIEQITSAKVNQTMGALGTPFIWGATNSWGGVRTNNFEYNQLLYADEIEPENLDEWSKKSVGEYNMAACFGCQVHCRAKYKVPDTPLARKYGLAGKYDEGPEYTSQGAFCSETGCTSLDSLLMANHLVDQYGVDNLEIGSLISWAMELYEHGILTPKQTDGLDLRFGNDDAMIEMIHHICKRDTWLGDVLAEGGLRAAGKIGKDSGKYLVHVKGMNNLHSDERATPGLALNIATASRGSDHLRSRPAIDLYHLPEPVLRKIYGSPVPYEGPLSSDHREYVGKPWQVYWQENTYMGVDCLGICKYHTTFLGATLPNFEDWSKVLYYNTGLELTPEQIWDVARRGNMVEKLFNLREGFERDDPATGDVLVDRYFDEPCRRGAPDVIGSVIDREKFNQMRAEFYQHKGLDELGVPTPETLKELGLDKIDSEPSRV
ncbi:MAG: aldehyde ferredoxin oxidoreductase [Deltaproteobacteria bacterium]|nr:aldehyde ferredoxin oxidoreductase [Deltaproteobacteria bacterium]